VERLNNFVLQKHFVYSCENSKGYLETLRPSILKIKSLLFIDVSIRMDCFMTKLLPFFSSRTQVWILCPLLIFFIVFSSLTLSRSSQLLFIHNLYIWCSWKDPVVLCSSYNFSTLKHFLNALSSDFQNQILL
jgi:hypothetical protein